MCLGEASSSISAVAAKAVGMELVIAMRMIALFLLCFWYIGLLSSGVVYVGSITFSIP